MRAAADDGQVQPVLRGVVVYEVTGMNGTVSTFYNQREDKADWGKNNK